MPFMVDQPQRALCPAFLSLDSKLTPARGRELVQTLGQASELRAAEAPCSYSYAYIRWGKDAAWLFRGLKDVAMRAHAHAYPFAFAGFAEPLKLVRFSGETRCHVPPRMDAGPGASCGRKLTLVWNISEPEDYDGGELNVYGPAGLQFVDKRGPDYVTVYPSYAVSLTRQVTRGIRWAIVAHLTGPAFV